MHMYPQLTLGPYSHGNSHLAAPSMHPPSPRVLKDRNFGVPQI